MPEQARQDGDQDRETTRASTTKEGRGPKKRTRRSTYPLEERGDDRYPSREAAQQAGIESLADAIARAVREGLESGRYTVEDGVVILTNPTTIDAALPVSGEREKANE